MVPSCAIANVESTSRHTRWAALVMLVNVTDMVDDFFGKF